MTRWPGQIIRYLAKRRPNRVDQLTCGFVGVSWGQGHFWQGIGYLLIGCALSVMAEIWSEENEP